jgi:hypothetical protein
VKLTHIVTASLVGILLVPRAGLAQSPAGPGGLHQSIEREARRLAQSGTAASSEPAPPKHRHWAARHPILFGTLLGAAGGTAMAQLSDHRYSDSDGRPIFLLGLVPGTLIGFWAGAVAAIVID